MQVLQERAANASSIIASCTEKLLPILIWLNALHNKVHRKEEVPSATFHLGNQINVYLIQKINDVEKAKKCYI
jgi:hypothetical protein